jgi:p21-activated kinase 1
VIEMVEGMPPHANLNVSRAMRVIPSKPSPTLSKEQKWSAEITDFVAKSLEKDPEKRPNAMELIMHPFIMKSLKNPKGRQFAA